MKINFANCEYFVVKLFSDNLAYVKIKRTKNTIIMHTNNVMQYRTSRLSENYCMEYFGHKIFKIYGKWPMRLVTAREDLACQIKQCLQRTDKGWLVEEEPGKCHPLSLSR